MVHIVDLTQNTSPSFVLLSWRFFVKVTLSCLSFCFVSLNVCSRVDCPSLPRPLGPHALLFLHVACPSPCILPRVPLDKPTFRFRSCSFTPPLTPVLLINVILSPHGNCCVSRVTPRYLSHGQEWSEKLRVREKTKVVKFSLNPVWNQEFSLPVRRYGALEGVFCLWMPSPPTIPLYLVSSCAVRTLGLSLPCSLHELVMFVRRRILAMVRTSNVFGRPHRCAVSHDVPICACIR